ncbi:MAG TPA: transporter substrate-binding domain-containing protein, partial [Burkholderiaceae bacterium]
TDDEVMQATAAGETAAGAVSAAALGYYNLTHPGRALRSLSMESLSAGLQWPVAIGMRRADTAFERAVDDVLRGLLADGTIGSIYARYGIAHRPPRPAPVAPPAR